MGTLKFKTNINCGGCIATITPILNAENGINKWDVDIANPSKILTVETHSLSAEDIILAVKKGGFKIEQLS